jgi:SEC-C motif
MSGLRSPWHRWEVDRSMRTRSDPEYALAARDDPCPCGSGKTLGNCHTNGATYEMPHFEIRFLDGMRPGLPPERVGEQRPGIDDMS